MMEYYAGDAKRIQHFIKVHSLAHLIGVKENLPQHELYRILVEADFLVNLYEDNAGEDAIKSAYDRIFRTDTGKELCRLMFGI
ncbi:MAG: hypothetical protein J1F01_04280 [Oscillospiraceae bacterium]|nr:hypothetical protein [Oscillospiraceae bacterium]